jgi:hypothetical protein
MRVTVGRLLCLSFLALQGCGDGGDGLPRVAVSGLVTLNGQPLTRGMISLDPIATAGAGPVSVGAVIIDGRYAIEREFGPTPGEYRVAIDGEPAEELSADEAQGRLTKKSAAKTKAIVPPKYNKATELKAQVTDSTTNRLDFDLTTR